MKSKRLGIRGMKNERKRENYRGGRGQTDGLTTRQTSRLTDRATDRQTRLRDTDM